MNSLFRLPDTDWSTLLKLYYGLTISKQFIECADKQLSSRFQDITGIDIGKNNVWINFDPEQVLNIEQAKNNTLFATLVFKYGHCPVVIRWRPKGNELDRLQDHENGCGEVDIFFDNIDVSLCLELVEPKWTLFPVVMRPNIIKLFRENSGISLSNEFIKCADVKLTKLFENLTGIKVDKNILLFPYRNDSVYENIEGTCRLKISLLVRDIRNDVIISFRTKSGKSCTIEQVQTNCDDLVFWFEHFNAVDIYNQYYPKKKKWFDSDNLNYQLTVTQVGVNNVLKITTAEMPEKTLQMVVTKVEQFIEKYNLSSEKCERRYGLVHKVEGSISENCIIFEIDSGSAGLEFWSKLFKYLSTIGDIKTVELT